MSIATRYWTYSELRAKVEQDLDLEGEVFIQPQEMLAYFNEAIDEAEKIVVGLYADYFLDFDTLTLVQGTDLYPLPAHIYAHKIRDMLYRNGTRAYKIMRMQDWKKFQEYTINLINGQIGSSEYRYFVVNQAAGAPRIIFSPPVAESGTYITIWFKRAANRLIDDTDVLDIPEASNYVMQFVKVRCYEKEGHPNLTFAILALQKQADDLAAALSDMIPDAENEIEMDLSFYEEMT